MTKEKQAALAPLFLRIAIGVGFIAHGYAKLSRGTAGFEKLLAQEGVPFAHLNGMISPWIEVLGGAAILIGFYVAISAAPLLFTMLVAIIFVQGHYGFSSVKTIGLSPQGPLFGPPGYEINILYIAGLISLMLTGAGAFSIDQLRKKAKYSTPAL